MFLIGVSYKPYCVYPARRRVADHWSCLLARFGHRGELTQPRSRHLLGYFRVDVSPKDRRVVGPANLALIHPIHLLVCRLSDLSLPVLPFILRLRDAFKGKEGGDANKRLRRWKANFDVEPSRLSQCIIACGMHFTIRNSVLYTLHSGHAAPRKETHRRLHGLWVGHKLGQGFRFPFVGLHQGFCIPSAQKLLADLQGLNEQQRLIQL